MNAEGVRGICGRCVFKGDTFRTRNALQIPVGQYDCGRWAAQKHTFRKRVGDLPQKQRISARKQAPNPQEAKENSISAEKRHEKPGWKRKKIEKNFCEAIEKQRNSAIFAATNPDKELKNLKIF